jgi:hypothetical protein
MNGAAPVIHLLLRSRPANVARLVISIVVDAVYRMLLAGSSANVSEKSGETISPFFVHSDSPASPIGVSGKFCVVATLFDMTPGSVLLGAVALTVSFASEAAAAFGIARPECTREYKRFIAAFTSAEPAQEYPAVWALPNYGEKPESLTSQILLSHPSIIGDSQWALAELLSYEATCKNLLFSAKQCLRMALGSGLES